jgi:hypothetical protein
MDGFYAYIWGGFFVLVVGGSLLLPLLSKFYTVKPQRLPYVAIPLLTDTERRFFFVLESVLPGHCYLLAQVRLANLVAVKPGSGFFWKQFSPISMKCVDFVVVQREAMRPVLVIELDDSSHKRTERQRRDQFVDQVLISVAIPVLHWPVQQHYSRFELSRAIEEKLKGGNL